MLAVGVGVLKVGALGVRVLGAGVLGLTVGCRVLRVSVMGWEC